MTQQYIIIWRILLLICEKPNFNAELEKVNVWLKVNKLTLNTSKTKVMIFIENRDI